MADDGIYTTNALIQVLAGINAGATEKAIAATDVYVIAVEAKIDVRSGWDWSSSYTAGDLDTTLRDILAMTGAAGCAMIVIMANINGYSIREREMQMNFCNSIYEEGMRALEDETSAALVKGDGD